MYRLYDSNNALIGSVDSLSYIRKNPNGCFGLCKQEQAQGIVYNGKVYKFASTEDLEECEVIFPVQVKNAPLIEANTAVASIAFVTMAESGNFDDVTMSEHADLFQEWQPNMSYSQGGIRRYDGKLYKCVQAHTSQDDWSPPDTPSLWSTTSDPKEEWPAWSQPIGAHDSYNAGDKVSHNGTHWVSSVANNVWEPGVYGWDEAKEE